MVIMGYEMLCFWMGFSSVILLIMTWILYKSYETLKGLVEELKKEISQ